MNIHKNARTIGSSRAEMVRRVTKLNETPKAVATAFGVSVRTVAKWLARYRAEGEADLPDRPSRPHRLRKPTPPAIAEQIAALRRQRITGKQIAITVGVSPATVSRVLSRLGLSRLRDLEPAEPVRRYEREHPGERIHIDIKKTRPLRARRPPYHRRPAVQQPRVGWEFVHVCIDDASRVAFSQILPDERKESAVAFLHAAIAYYRNLGITVTLVMTDNGSCYRSRAFRDTCKALELRHIRTRPYTLKTNGKAERFIQTSLREWAYAIAYPTSNDRKAALDPWLHNYNWHRPHGSLKSKTPISRLGLERNNLLRLHT
ncbi:IS481 family transposase [Sphingomonas hengshuiensis]|uniref:IS481 family transposase n=1 Tax=Sphingomonas hengshuiensis TaxID=1609977 RepID=UPI000ACB2413|nr:IS481 family transposase [Sphingomonas hengshuiensis]